LDNLDETVRVLDAKRVVVRYERAYADFSVHDVPIPYRKQADTTASIHFEKCLLIASSTQEEEPTAMCGHVVRSDPQAHIPVSFVFMENSPWSLRRSNIPKNYPSIPFFPRS
jgi:hypothetical protein